MAALVSPIVECRHIQSRGRKVIGVSKTSLVSTAIKAEPE